MSGPSSEGQAPRAPRLNRLLPLAAFVVLAGILYLGFTLRDPTLLPSALVGQPFPEFDLPTLGDPPGRAGRDDIAGEVRLVNVWATWCPTCLAEHGELMRIRRETGLSIVGVNYKDDPVGARAWLDRHGDPYDFNVVDAAGDLGVELGVYGAPETFVVDAAGTIRYKRVGEVNGRVWKEEIAPLLAELGTLGDG